FFRMRPMTTRAVLRDDQIEQTETREHRLQTGNLSPRHEHDLAPRLPQPFERGDRRVIDAPVMSDRAVVVGAEREVAHCWVIRLELRCQGNVEGGVWVPGCMLSTRALRTTDSTLVLV